MLKDKLDDLKEFLADEMKDSLWYRQTPGRCEELAQIVREHG